MQTNSLRAETNPYDPLLSLRELSAILGRKKSALYVDLKENRLAAVKVGGATRVRKSELDRYLSALPRAQFAPTAAMGVH
jgi:excisionase family DNA binding protein